MFDMVRLGYFKLGQVMSEYITLWQVRLCDAILFQVRRYF